MDTLQNMHAFRTVASAGSFTAAAELLHTTTANVSRAVSHLEGRLKTRLLQRTTRRLSLTEAGRRYLLNCELIMGLVQEAEFEARSAHTHASGQVKMHTMTGIGMYFVIDAIAEYRKLYPEVTFDLTLANHVPDLLDEGYDISIVLASVLPDSGFVSQKLGATYSIVCASPDYVEENGFVSTPFELSSHGCIRNNSSVFELGSWRFSGPDGIEDFNILSPLFQANSVDAVKAAIISGMGVGVLPIYTAVDCLRAGSLVRLLPEYRLQELNLYAVYPSRHYLDAKIKTWLEYLRGSLPYILATHGIN
ncbi:LysR family transcriptional regulator [Pseudomonas putida]|uniref:LysR family transcriptional regulator n=1 Tax=Pseudomonas putida TaxID=303 RepID=UPI0011799451|nr:LysR family transcriptional regulator [Pseudomonas putida]TRO38254.1 LysR family transcriptional regulator [Pseudomonas putida]